MLRVVKPGESLKISKNGESVKRVVVEVSWKSKIKIDADLTTVALKEDPKFPYGRGVGDAHVCFYGQPSTVAMVSSGDDRGNADGTESGEAITIDFTKLPAETTSVSALLTLHKAVQRGHAFKLFEKVEIKVIDADTKEVLMISTQDQFGANDISMLFAMFRRDGNGFTFESVCKTFDKTIADYFIAYGFEVEE